MRNWLLIILVVALGAILRVLLLDQFPAGVTADELQQGYTGYSILKTGKDEWGDFLPINPRSLGEYKLPLYSYLTVPFQAILGLNLYSIRLPSALAGVVTISLLFLLAKKIFKDNSIALLSSIFLTISWWHITYSRIGWESNIGLPLFLGGFLLFIKSFEDNKWLILSALCFGLSLFTYWSFKLFIPLFVIGLIIINRGKVKSYSKKIIILTSIIVILFTSVVVFGWFFSGGSNRASDSAIYNLENITQLRLLQTEDKLPDPWRRIINNRVTFTASKFLENYLGYFSTTFYASPYRSDSTLFNLPGAWLIPLWQLIFFIIGLLTLIKEKIVFKKELLLWIILAPIPASLTREYMHTQRVEILLLMIPLISAFGVFKVARLIKSIYRRYVIVGLSLLIIFSFIYQSDQYIFHVLNKDLGGLKFGYEEAIKYTEENKDKYDKIIFTKEYSNPQIFLAFYTKMDPNVFQQYSKSWKTFESEGYKFVDMIDLNLGKYNFRNIDYQRERNEKNTLIVAFGDDLPLELERKKTIKSPSGKIIFEIIDTSDLKKDEN